MDHVCRGNTDGFACKAGIGHVARVAAQEVIGDAAADTVELDALPDQPAAGQGAVHVERQHLGRQHLQLQWHGEAVFRPARSDAEEHLAREEHFARRPALQPVEIRQPLGVSIIGPGEPQRLKGFLGRCIRDGAGWLDAITHDIAGEGFHGIGRIAIVAHQPARPGGDRVARGGDQCVHMGAAGPKSAQTPVGLGRVEPAEDRAQSLAEGFKCHGSQAL